MKKFNVVSIIAIAFAISGFGIWQQLNAQDLAFRPVFPDTSKLNPPANSDTSGTVNSEDNSPASKLNPSVNSDTSGTVSSEDNSPFPEESKPKLLPDRMSFMEKFLWDENGFVRKVGLASPLSPQERESELHVRRTMLYAHQIGGFTTLGLMIAASFFGQKIIDGHRNYNSTHQALVAGTIGSYALTGLLAILSPPPLIRREEESTITIHKTLAWAHFAGMILTPILGQAIGGRRNFNTSKAHVHQIAAYATTAVFTLSMIVITF